VDLYAWPNLSGVEGSGIDGDPIDGILGATALLVIGVEVMGIGIPAPPPEPALGGVPAGF
jgi:hypothetical protein